MVDALAKRAKLCTGQQVWLDYIPADIAPLVSFLMPIEVLSIRPRLSSFSKKKKKEKKKKKLRVLFENVTVKN